jgi:SNF2 family DNA or RNA helicase
MEYIHKCKPFLHQDVAFKRFEYAPFFAIFADMGTGKTKMVIDQAGVRYLRGEIDTLLVISLNLVGSQNWISELEAHMSPGITYKAAYYMSGPRVAHKERVAAVCNATGVFRIMVVHVDALSHESGISFCEDFIAKHKAMVIVDESQTIKNPTSRRTKHVTSLGKEKAVVAKAITTGTPLDKGWEDLYAQFRFLNPAIIGCRTFAAFRALYCQMGGFEGRQIVGHINLPELKAKLEPHTFSVRSEDCQDLPEQMFMERKIELTPEQKKLYDALRNEFFAELDSGEILEADIAMTRLTRLRQVTSGFLPNDDGTFQHIPSNRPQEVLDILEEAGGKKVIIWCLYKESLRILHETFRKAGIGVAHFHGLVAPEKRATELARFKEHADCQGLLSSTAVGGACITVNEAKVQIFYENGFSYLQRAQALKRNHRHGQTERVAYYDIIAKGTMDTKVINMLKKKESVAIDVRSVGALRGLLETI